MECGGGTILIYLLTAFLKTDQHISQGANLVFFILACVTSIVVNIRNKSINYNIAKTIIICGIIGAVVGAKLSINLPINDLKKYFGVFLIIIAINEIYSLKREYINYKKTNNNKKVKRRDK